VSTGASRRCVVVEDDHHGHRLMYVATFASGVGAAADCQTVLLTTRSVVNSVEFREHVCPLVEAEKLELLVAEEAGESGLNSRAILRHTNRGDLVIILDGDRRLLALPLIFATRRGVLLLMRTEGNGFRWHLSRWSKAAVCAIPALSGRWFFRKLVESGAGAKPKRCRATDWMSEVEDPGPSAVAPDDALVTPESYLLLCGVIDTRKSLTQLLQWAADSTVKDPPTLVVAGQATPGAADILSQELARRLIAAGRLQVIPRFLTNGELATLHIRSEAVLALHENPGPSGAVAHAAAFGRPVITWGSDAVRRGAEVAGIGLHLPDRDVASIDAAVARLRAEPRSEGARNLAGDGSAQRFVMQLLDGRA
jgi:hypothetical protein